MVHRCESVNSGLTCDEDRNVPHYACLSAYWLRTEFEQLLQVILLVLACQVVHRGFLVFERDTLFNQGLGVTHVCGHESHGKPEAIALVLELELL